jgi:hypothetical protein
MLKLILIILASPQPLKTSFHGIWLAQNLAFRSACTTLPCGEDRLRLGNAQINFDNFGFASAIENKFSWHLACTKFGIPLGLHYLCRV